MASKEELVEKLDELKPLLERTLASEKGVFDASGKPFDLSGWLLGQPLDQKYPTGPAYKPLPGRPTLLSCSTSISVADWGYTLFSAAFLYTWGYRHNNPVFKFTGHRLGLLVAAPMLVLGYTNGLHRAYLRHVGLMANGNDSVYPGYEEDATPYHVKHKVSDRHFEVQRAPERVIHLEGRPLA